MNTFTTNTTGTQHDRPPDHRTSACRPPSSVGSGAPAVAPSPPSRSPAQAQAPGFNPSRTRDLPWRPPSASCTPSH